MGYNDSWAMGRPQTQLRCPQMDSTRSQFLALCQLWKRPLLPAHDSMGLTPKLQPRRAHSQLARIPRVADLRK